MRLPSHHLSAALMLAFAAVSCGVDPSAPATSSESAAARFDPIIGGVADDTTVHDAVVLLYNVDVGAMCTGTLVSQDGERGVVITARHCVAEVLSEYVTCKEDVGDTYPASNLYIMRGANPQHGASAYLGSGDKIFTTTGASLCNADFAVIVMQEKVSGILPFRVRTSADAYATGEVFTAIGYGLTNPNSQNSAGNRYLREGVKLSKLGPTLYGLYSKEFQGTTSICSGDSGGPAVSANWAVMGVTSRGGSCYGNDNIWTRVDGFKDILDEAMAYAHSTYIPEEGAPPWPGEQGTGGTGGDPGTGGAGGSATGGTGGDDTPITGGAAGSEPAGPSCGDEGPCAEGSVCKLDSSTGFSACVAICDATTPCPGGATCDPVRGVCTAAPSPGTAEAAALEDGVAVTGGCALAAPNGTRNGAGALLAAAALALAATRRRKS